MKTSLKQDVVEFNNHMIYTITELGANRVFRKWCAEDGTYCYQFIDFDGCDDEITELSHGYVAADIDVCFAYEYCEYEYTADECVGVNYSVDGRVPLFVYYNNDEEAPYVGVENVDGTFAVVGARFDSIVSAEEMFQMVMSK